MLKIVSRVTRPFSAVEWTLATVGRQIQDYVPRGAESQNLARDAFKVIPEGALIRREQRESEKIFLGSGGWRLRCGYRKSVASVL